ncbi:translation initiation factor IF-2-like [Panthera pardus]|uniref:Translation initiation factor IF-2-like n=1 Tax=Panthera pardus TaxID=9691 RepID=A0A9W2UM15_PANPR|nr:translation initiation factor IF-2-like [Panthera pardus]
MTGCNPCFLGLVYLCSQIRGFQVVRDLGGQQVQPVNPDVPRTKYTHTRPFPKLQAQRRQKRGGIPRGPTTQWGPLPHSSHPTRKARVRLLGALSLLPCSPPGRPSRSRFPPPSLGSRKTRSEPALLGSACSVASRFSSLVGSSSATPASAAAAAAPPGSQILQRRPRAFPLPRYPPAPLRLGQLAFRGRRCAERAPRPERPSARPPPAAGSAAGPGRARERSPGGRRPRRRAARGGAGGPGRGGGPAPGRWCGMPPPPPPGCVRSPRLVPVSGGWPGASLAPQPPLQG